MKRLELKPTVRYFASTRPPGFLDRTLYLACELNGSVWFIQKQPSATRVKAFATTLDHCLRHVERGTWRELTLPDSVLYSREIAQA